MSSNKQKAAAQIRSGHNRELIRRMRSGESLTSFDSHASWFPPRPTIEKDPKAMERLYGDVTPIEEAITRTSVMKIVS